MTDTTRKVNTPKTDNKIKITSAYKPVDINVKSVYKPVHIKLSSVFVSDVTIDIGETETLPYGVDAYVTNSGDTKHAILNFGLPQGNGIDHIEYIKEEGLFRYYKIWFTNGQYFEYKVKNGAGGIWGQIDGILSEQEDLQEALDAKQDVLTAQGTLTITDNIIRDNTFIFEQGLASAQWEIVHDLGKYPSVTVIDSGNNTIEGAVTYIDENSLIINFNASFTGKAYLN